MSDPNGQGTTPEVPTFAPPKGYASTTLSVKNLEGTAQVVQPQNTPYAQKGYAPGTFVTKEPVIKVPTLAGSPPKVGGEIRNPETEKLIAHGKAALEAGVEPVYDNQGNLISVTLPDGFVSEEEVNEKVAAVEAMKNADIKILHELISVYATYTSLDNELLPLKPKLQNPSTLALIEQLSQEIQRLVEEIKDKPLYTKLDELKTKLKEFEEVTERAKDEVAKIPKPPVATPAPTPAPTPTPTPAPAPTAAPRPPEPLKEYGGWPTTIYYRKQKNLPVGWVSSVGGVERILPEQDGWALEYETFKIVFKKYLDFIRSISVSDRRIVKELVDIKNEVVGAIKNGDLTATESLREKFEETIEIWVKRWETVKKVKALEAQLISTQKKVLKLSANQQQLVVKEGQEATSLVQNGLIALSGKDIEAEDVQKMSKAVDVYVQHVEVIAKDSAKNVAGILRPVVINNKNEGQTIVLRGTGSVESRTKTLGEWKTQNPLLHDNYKEKKELNEKLEKEASYQELLARHRELYPELPTDTSTPDYSAKKKDAEEKRAKYLSVYQNKQFITGDPTKRVVEEVLGAKTQTPGTMETRAREAKEKERESLDANKQVYSPARDPYYNKKQKEDTRTEEEKLAPAPIVPLTEAPYVKGMIRPEQAQARGAIPNNQEKGWMEKALGKISKIISTREANLMKKGVVGFTAFALAYTAGNTLYNKATSEEKITPDVEASQKKEAVEKPYLEFITNKALNVDLLTLSIEDLVEKHAKKCVDPAKPDSLVDCLNMDAVKILSPEPLVGIREDQREQLYTLILGLQKLSQEIDTPTRLQIVKKGGTYTIPSDWFVKDGQKVKDYIALIKTKALQANA